MSTALYIITGWALALALALALAWGYILIGETVHAIGRIWRRSARADRRALIVALVTFGALFALCALVGVGAGMALHAGVLPMIASVPAEKRQDILSVSVGFRLWDAFTDALGDEIVCCDGGYQHRAEIVRDGHTFEALYGWNAGYLIVTVEQAPRLIYALWACAESAETIDQSVACEIVAEWLERALITHCGRLDCVEAWPAQA